MDVRVGTIRKAECSKNWCFWTVVLEKTLERPLDCKEMQPVNPKRNQSWKVIRRTDAEAETPILWPPDVKNWLIGKDSDAGKDLRQGEKGTTGWDDWMASRTQWTWAWANSGRWWRTGSLACCSPWGPAESDLIERLNWTDEELKPVLFKFNQSWWGGGRWLQRKCAFPTVVGWVMPRDVCVLILGTHEWHLLWEKGRCRCIWVKVPETRRWSWISH